MLKPNNNKNPYFKFCYFIYLFDKTLRNKIQIIFKSLIYIERNAGWKMKNETEKPHAGWMISVADLKAPWIFCTENGGCEFTSFRVYM